MKCNITFTYIKVRIKAQWIHLTSINVHVQNHINHIIYGVHKTYTSAIEDGMFSSTHFRSSSWGNQVYFNYYSFIGGCWAYKRKVSYHFIRFRTSIGLCFKTSHFYTLCELNKMVEIKWQKKKNTKKNKERQTAFSGKSAKESSSLLKLTHKANKVQGQVWIWYWRFVFCC